MPPKRTKNVRLGILISVPKLGNHYHDHAYDIIAISGIARYHMHAVDVGSEWLTVNSGYTYELQELCGT